MSELQRQQEHYRKVKERLQPVRYVFDPEAPYQRGNRKLHPATDPIMPCDPPLEMTAADRAKERHRINMRDRQRAIRKAQKAAKARTQEKTYEQWEADDAQAVARNGSDARGSDAGIDASAGKQFTPKASAEGFKRWLEQQRGKQDPASTGAADASRAGDEQTEQAGNAQDAGEGQSAQVTLPSLDYQPTTDASNDASRDIK